MKTKELRSQVKFTNLYFLVLIITLSTFSLKAQLQIGMDIDGEAAGDWSGHSVSMPDAYTVAIGARNNSNGNGSFAGHARIYRWNGITWVQKGMDIDGEAAGNSSGYSVSMPDSNTLAIGALNNDGNGTNAGHVRVYRWNGTAWGQKGIDIDGEAGGDASGLTVSMPDSNTVAIGAPFNDGNGTDAGHVRIYRWNGTAWGQKGLDIDGIAIHNHLGWSVSMPDSNTVAIGVPHSYNYIGYVSVYSWNGVSWVQKGLDIDGEAPADMSGYYVSMPDPNTVAIGAIKNDGNGTDAGHVRIYKWDGISWMQRGVDIDGEASGDSLGWSVSMPDSNTIAIGAMRNDGNGTDAGHVRVYSICTNAVDTSVTLSGNTLIANDSNVTYQWVNCDSAYATVNGAINRSFIPPNTGNYSVIVSRSHCVDTSACYNVVVTGINEDKGKKNQFIVYPNPTNGAFTIESNAGNNNTPFEIRDISGKIVLKGNLRSQQTTLDLSDYSSGIYLLRVKNQNKKIVIK